MESLFNYGSEEENEDAQDNDEVQKAESDTNYDHVTMDMSDDSSSSVNGCGQIITDRIENEDGISGEIGAPEVGEGDKSSGFSSSDSCCSLAENDSTSIRDKLYREKSKNSKSCPEYKSYSGDKYSDNKVDNSKRQSQQRTSHSKSTSRDISGHDSDEANSEEENDCDYDDDNDGNYEIAKYRDREGRIRDRDRERERDRNRHRSRSRERSHVHDRHRSRSPTSDRHHSSKHYSHRSHHSMSRERDSRSRNRSRSREKSRSSYENKRQNKLTILEKLGIELKVPDSGGMTPQMALQKSMEEQITKVKNATGISLPSYYNPIAVNPTRYAEQMQKRKLLWGGNQKQVNNQTGAGKESNNAGPAASAVGSTAGPASLWQGARFSQDQDGKLMAKFKRLMGIKQGSGEGSSGEGGTGTDLIKKQEEMFNSMEMQYEVARVATHTHRGLGLGFGVHQYPR